MEQLIYSFIYLFLLINNGTNSISAVNVDCTIPNYSFIISFNPLKVKSASLTLFPALIPETLINFSATALTNWNIFEIIFLLCPLTLSGIEKHQCWNLDAKILIFYPFPARVLYWFPFASRTGWPDSDCTEPILNRWWQLELTLEDRSLNRTTTDGFVSFNSSREEKGGCLKYMSGFGNFPYYLHG